LLLPSIRNVQTLLAALGSDLAEAFQHAGVPTQPPVDIQLDSRNGHIRVSANRPDAAQIEDTLNSDPQLARKIRTTLAISSHAYGIQRSLQFHREYLHSDNPDEVVARYGHLFGAPQKHETALRFEGTSITVLNFD